MNSNIKKVLVVAAVCAIPLGVFAYDKYERHNGSGHSKYDKDGSNCGQSSYHQGKHMGHFMDDDEDDFFFGNEFFIKNGANLAFEGKIENKPTKGFNGTWKISGMDVLVNDDTKIFIDKDTKRGDEVNLLAKREAGKIIALQLELD